MRTSRRPLPTRSTRRSAAALAVALLGLGAPALTAAPSNLPTSAPTAQDRQARPDQIVVQQSRGRGNASVSGTVVEATLRKVVVETRDGEQRDYDNSQVVRIVLGDVPTQYTDAGTFLQREAFEDAAIQYRLAIDETSRSVVKAAARLGSARALLMLGTQDPNRLADAIAEAERFQTQFPESRDLPEARRIAALAKRLSGDAAGAAADYRALFDEAAGGTPSEGYSAGLCYLAGQRAAEAFLAAGDAANARSIYASIAADLPGVLAAVEDDSTRAQLMAVEAAARLGEGYALLTEDKASRARAFFDSQLSENDSAAALRFGARLGLGEALLAEGDAAAARFEFAEVSALDFTDRHRTARALLGLARCAVELGDGTADPRVWLASIRDDFSDTPSGPDAAALEQSL